MLCRLVSLFLLLAISTGNITAVFSYLQVGKQDVCCSSKSVSEANKSCSMACCAQGKSPIGSPAAKLCCDTTCGEHDGGDAGSQPENSRQVPSPNISFIIIPLSNWSFLEKLLVTSKFLESNFFYSQPTEIYLQNSAFLI